MFRGCCVVLCAGTLVISLRLLLTTKMVSMHVYFPSSRYFVAFVCVCADCVQSMACLFTIHAAVWKFSTTRVSTEIIRYRPTHEAFVDKRNSIPYGNGTSRCHCTAIYMKHCVSCTKHTVVLGSVAQDSSLIREITQLQFLLHRRRHFKHTLALARTLTLLLLLGGDIEPKPGPSKRG